MGCSKHFWFLDGLFLLVDLAGVFLFMGTVQIRVVITIVIAIVVGWDIVIKDNIDTSFVIITHATFY